jgi:hypothetical protein
VVIVVVAMALLSALAATPRAPAATVEAPPGRLPAPPPAAHGGSGTATCSLAAGEKCSIRSEGATR